MLFNFEKRSFCKLSAIVLTTLAISACNLGTDTVNSETDAVRIVAKHSDKISTVYNLKPFDQACYYSFAEAPRNTQYYAVAMNIDVKENGSLEGTPLQPNCKPQDKKCKTDLPGLVAAVQLYNESQSKVDDAFLAIQSYLVDEKRNEEGKGAFIKDDLLNGLDTALVDLDKAKAGLEFPKTPIDMEKLQKSTNIAYILKDKHWIFTDLGLESKPLLQTTSPIPFSVPKAVGEGNKAFSIKYYRRGIGKKCRYGFDLDIIITDTDVTLSTPIRVDPLIGNDGGGG